MTNPSSGAAAAPKGLQGPSEWARAYSVAMLNALLFLVLSMFNWAMSIEALPMHIGVAAIFFVGSLLSFWRLLRAGGQLAAISFFVLGAGVFFGLGAVYSGIAPDRSLVDFYGSDLLPRTFGVVNLLNSVSVVIVLATAWLFASPGPRRIEFASSLQGVMEQISPLRGVLFFISFIVITAQLATFPIAENLILRTLLNHLTSFSYVTLLVGAMHWPRSSLPARSATLALLIGMALLGLLSLAKTTMMLPLVAFGAGLLFDRRSRNFLLVFGALAAAGYFLFFAQLCNDSRNHPYYGDDNSIGDRARIVSETGARILENRVEYRRRSTPLMQRFATVQVQGYLIDRYNAGSPGQSLKTAWEAVVPRYVWRDKPIITRFGPELDRLVFRRERSGSSLAPSYSAEAYWNAGWGGLLLVSLVLGAELGWLTRKWNAFTRDGTKHFGVLVLAIPIAWLSSWVETWFVATYIGGFVTLLVLMKITDVGVQILLAQRRTGAKQAGPDSRLAYGRKA